MIRNQIPGEPAMAQENSDAAFMISPSSLPYHNQYVDRTTYNSQTKQYYMLRSYLEHLEQVGGGTLTLTKGTYVITNTLYVSSNIMIVLEDGAKIIKGKDSGTSKFLASKSLFQLIAPSKSKERKTTAKYDGETNISIKGEGNAIIDMDFMKNAKAIVMGHNANILVQGITFQNMYQGNFIKIAASKAVKITDNTFRYYKRSYYGTKEAISLEIPDINTRMFLYKWSNQDQTVNQNITIVNNTFFQLERAIGSVKYTQNQYQKDIKIENNEITGTSSHGIRILNWENAVIKDNIFSDITNGKKNAKGIVMSGGVNPTITHNTFRDMDRPIQIMPWKNNHYGSDYEISYNNISEENKLDMLSNHLENMREYFIRYNKTYGVFDKNTEKWEIYDDEVSSYTVEADSVPFQNQYINYRTYNENTRQYYVLRSYLEQLERIGGGILHIKQGTYELSNVLYVPSNVTINFEDGVVLKKIDETKSEDIESSKSMFQLVAPSKSKQSGAYGGYNGEHDISFIGEGDVIIDLGYVKDSIGIILGHNKNVTITGIRFLHMNGGHFIELDASQDVVIKDNQFRYHKTSKSGIKEAINIDTPDKTTGGFNSVWTTYDRTPNKDILITNNYFENLERAIGTHKYSEGKYHENIQITENTIYRTDSDAIRMMNWKNPIVKENKIEMVAGGGSNDRAILASGLVNPTITDNTFIDMARPIQIMPWKNHGRGEEYAITYNDISQVNIDLMLKNQLIRVGESFLRINKIYNEFRSGTVKYYYTNQYIQW